MIEEKYHCKKKNLKRIEKGSFFKKFILFKLNMVRIGMFPQCNMFNSTFNRVKDPDFKISEIF